LSKGSSSYQGVNISQDVYVYYWLRMCRITSVKCHLLVSHMTSAISMYVVSVEYKCKCLNHIPTMMM